MVKFLPSTQKRNVLILCCKLPSLGKLNDQRKTKPLTISHHYWIPEMVMLQPELCFPFCYSKIFFGKMWSITLFSWPYASVTQLFPTLCKPMDCSPPGFCVHGIFRSRILQWVAISSSRGSFLPRDGTRISCVLHCRQILYHCATCLDKVRSVYFILSFFTAN